MKATIDQRTYVELFVDFEGVPKHPPVWVKRLDQSMVIEQEGKREVSVPLQHVREFIKALSDWADASGIAP